VSCQPPEALREEAVEGRSYGTQRPTPGPIDAEVHMTDGQHTLDLRFSHLEGSFLSEGGPFRIRARLKANQVYHVLGFTEGNQRVRLQVLQLGSPARWAPRVARLLGASKHWRKHVEVQAAVASQPRDSPPDAEFCFGCYALLIGDLEAARKAFAASLDGYRSQNAAPWRRALCHANIGRCALGLRKGREAAERFERALALSEHDQREPRLRAQWTTSLGRALLGTRSRRAEAFLLMRKGLGMLSCTSNFKDRPDARKGWPLARLGTDLEAMRRGLGFRLLGVLEKPLTVTQVAPPPPVHHPPMFRAPYTPSHFPKPSPVPRIPFHLPPRVPIHP